MSGGYELIEKRIKSYQKLERISGYGCILLGIGLCSFFYGIEGAELTEVMLRGVSPVALLTVGGGLLFKNYRERAGGLENNPLLQAIKGDPDKQVAWVYLNVITDEYNNAQHNIWIHFIGRKKSSYRLPVNTEDSEPIMLFLMERFPNAYFGYDKKIEKQYKANPQQYIQEFN